ncbi:MAG: hypothetical protein R3F29_06855 [Planctomycetota bacterium]
MALLSLVSAASSQVDPVAETLAKFTDDRLPVLLRQLQGPLPQATVSELRDLGERAHRILFGAMRLPVRATDFAAAFGGFGTHSTWALPGLMEAASGRFLSRTASDLLERLGPSAAPALPILRAHGHERLADRIAAAGHGVVDARPLPAVEVDPAQAEALLALLRSTSERARWWPAVQALLQLDVGRSVDACAVLLAAAVGDDAGAAQQARDLLYAMRCHHAAFALLDVEVAAELPAVAGDELLRTVLATWPWWPRPDGKPSWSGPSLPAALVTSDDPLHITVCALAVALNTLELPAQRRDPAVLRGLRDRATDDRARLLVDAALELMARHEAEVVTQPLSALRTEALSAYQQLSDEAIRRTPPARLREALDAARPPQVAKVEGQGLAAEVLRSGQTPTAALEARFPLMLVRELVMRVPALVLSLDLDPVDRAVVLAAVGHEQHPPAELHDWLIDSVDLSVPDQSLTPKQTLGIDVAPAVERALADPARRARMLELLFAYRHLLYWAQFRDRIADQLAALRDEIPAERRRDYYALFAHGDRARRAFETMVLDPATTAAERAEMLKSVGPSPLFRPGAPLVLTLLASDDDREIGYGVSAAGLVQDRQDEVFAALCSVAGSATDRLHPFCVRAVAQLRLPAARQWLIEQLQDQRRYSRANAAVGLLDLDDAPQAAIDELHRQLHDEDRGIRLGAWMSVAQGEGASARFLELAVDTFGQSTDWQETSRLFRVLETAAVRRPEDVRGLLQRFRSCGDSMREQQAAQVLRQLDEGR